jgi:choline dehydrogenase-like flavoprotein
MATESDGPSGKPEFCGLLRLLLTYIKLSLIFYQVKDPQLTYDRLVYEPGSLATTYELWKNEKTGFMSIFPFGIFGWARLDDRLKDSELWQEAQKKAPKGRDPMRLTNKQPHVEYWNTELYGGGPQFTDFPVGQKGAFALAVILMNELSRGTVTLDKNDRLGAPIVDHNYLADPLDELVLAEACRYGNEILMEGKATKNVIVGSWPEDLTHHKNVSRDDWASFVRGTVGTCYHPSGTCKMASSSSKDPLGVVDERLRVRGVANLRVVDVSIMPIVNNGLVLPYHSRRPFGSR